MCFPGLVGAIALVPTCALVSNLNLVGNRGPLFFRQLRVGKGGREFTILKFRTMPPCSNDSNWTSIEDVRLGHVGSDGCGACTSTSCPKR